jgi:hypothetical protein
MDGMYIVISGTRATDELKKQVEEKGGHVCSGFTKKTTHLVVKETTRGSQKIEEAREKGIAVISLEDFLAEHGINFEVPKRVHKAEPIEHEAKPKSPKKVSKKAAEKAAEVEALQKAIADHDAMVQRLTEELEQKVFELKAMREKLNAMS